MRSWRPGRPVLVLLAPALLGLAGCDPPPPPLVVTIITTADLPDAAPGDGVCEATAGTGDCSLRAAVQEANGGAPVPVQATIPNGVYPVTGVAGDDLAASGDLDLTGSLTLTGSGGARITGSGADRVFDLRGGSLTLTAVTVTGGSTAAAGGGVRVEGGLLSLDRTTVSGNVAGSGGGLAVVDGIAGLLNTTIANNTATAGGGGVAVAGGLVVAAYTTIAANGGGGIAADAPGTAAVQASILGETASGPACSGGGVSSSGYNVVADATCAFAAVEDAVGVATGLNALSGLASQTATMLPGLGSPAHDRIPRNVAGCSTSPAVDQRGVTRPRNFDCDSGAAEIRQTELWTTTTFIPGLVRPWDFAFAPDGAVLFTERGGRVGVRFPGGSTGTVATIADVVAVGEGGLLGLALDPQFASNRRIYACLDSNISGANDIRVVRFEVDAGYTSLLARTDILTGIKYSAVLEPGRHSGCRPRFGPDGYLWVTTGDGAMPTPQDPTVLNGKVLRIDTDGAPAPGNMGAPFLPEVYTIGHRNSQGLAFRPSDGTPFEVEHGTHVDDEVNVLVAGANYGWDPSVPGDPGAYVPGPMTDLARHPDALEAKWSSGDPTIAPSGATFVTGSQWKLLDGTLVLACLTGQQLRFTRFDPTTNALEREWGASSPLGRLRVAVQGPDGALYVAVDSATGQIARIVPTGL